MAINSSEKTALLFKKYATGKATTALSDTFKYYNEAYNSRVSILTTQVWKESNKIPDIGVKIWSSGQVYDPLDHVFRDSPDDDTLYECIAEHTSSSTYPENDTTN